MAAPVITKTSKKIGKENAPQPRTTKHRSVDDDDTEDFDTFSGEDDGSKKASKPVSKPAAKPLGSRFADDEVNGQDDVHRDTKRGGTDLQRKLIAITGERDRLRTQRDTFSKQFEELSKTRSTEVEGLFEKYKQKAEVAAKSQNDIIANQTALTDKLQAKVQALEKALAAAKETSAASSSTMPSAGGPFEAPAKADPKEIKALKEELGRVKAESQGKDSKIAELQREYKAEVEHSRSLQASTRGSAAPPTTSAVSTNPEEVEKDTASLALYEDLTMLNIANVKIKPGRYGKESTFNCILAMNQKSLNFKLRCFTDVDRTQEKPTYVKTVHYTPELLEHESEAFVQKLEYFATQFVVPRDQLGGFLAELRLRFLDDE